ncbi:MAG: type II toxin-antitoxin system VapB family antitoxin [Blastochloris sp.]|nr:type II toxin-antitoxin system VapB family antitoxin [Blastochloris sp.]
MKMTMHIDEALLDRVMKAYGFVSKTDAVEGALREMDRRKQFDKLWKKGLGLSKQELGNLFDPGYNLMALRVAETPGKAILPPPDQAPQKARYGKKRSR